MRYRHTRPLHEKQKLPADTGLKPYRWYGRCVKAIKVHWYFINGPIPPRMLISTFSNKRHANETVSTGTETSLVRNRINDRELIISTSSRGSDSSKLSRDDRENLYESPRSGNFCVALYPFYIRIVSDKVSRYAHCAGIQVQYLCPSRYARTNTIVHTPRGKPRVPRAGDGNCSASFRWIETEFTIHFNRRWMPYFWNEVSYRRGIVSRRPKRNAYTRNLFG